MGKEYQVAICDDEDQEESWFRIEGFDIRKKDILYVESLGDEAAIYDFDHHYIVKRTIRQLENQLGVDFFRCHRSYIVNMRHIQYIEGCKVYMETAQVLPIAVRRQKELKKNYLQYIKNKGRCL